MATEDKRIIQFFKETFGDGFGEFCITIDKGYIDYIPGKWAVKHSIDRENDRFLQGKEYLTEVVLLSMCNSFIAAFCSGAASAMMLANNFENTYVFDLGLYGVYPVNWRKLIAQ